MFTPYRVYPMFPFTGEAAGRLVVYVDMGRLIE
jgi:hypothetical protein